MAGLDHMADGVNPNSNNSIEQARAGRDALTDHVQRLKAAITTARKQRSKAEPVIVSRMQERTELYEKAYVQVKQATIDAVADNIGAAERNERQNEALHKRDLEVLPPDLVAKLATVDARDYAKLHDSRHRAAAIVAIADTARLSTGYRAALASKSSEVSGAVESAIGATIESKDKKPPYAKLNGERDQGEPSALSGPALKFDLDALERVARKRASDAKAVAQQLGTNSIEQVVEHRQLARSDAQAVAREAADKPVALTKPTSTRPQGGNQVSADEVFTASKDDAKPIVPAEVQDKYLQVGTKFYHPKYTHVVAFEDKGNQLETRSNSEQIAGAMVAIARARGWDEIKVAGSETFRREVWLEAATHGMHVKGYTPSAVDKAELAKRTKDVEANQLAPVARAPARERQSDGKAPSSIQAPPSDSRKREVGLDHAAGPQPTVGDRKRAQAFAQQSSADAVAAHPELAGVYAAMASIRKKIAADGLSAEQSAVVMARVGTNLVNSIERGQLPTANVRHVQEQVEPRREPTNDKERGR